MKRIVLSLIACGFLAGASQGQSGPYDWSGFYLGVNGSVSSTKTSVDAGNISIQQITNIFVTGRGIVVVPGTSRPFTESKKEPKGGGGFQAGYLWQTGRLVLGGEADLSPFKRTLSVSKTDQLPTTLLTQPTTVVFRRDIRLSTELSLRGRVGVAFDRSLVYGTAGYANAGVRVATNDSFSYSGGLTQPCVPPQSPCSQLTIGPVGPVITTGSEERRLGGFTGGFGFEQAVGGHVRIGGEYRYSKLGPATFTPANGSITNTGPVPVGSNGQAGNAGQVAGGPTVVKITSNALRFFVNYRF